MTRALGFKQRAILLVAVFAILAVALGLSTHAALSVRDEAVADITGRIAPARGYVYDLAQAVSTSAGRPGAGVEAMGALTALLDDSADFADDVDSVQTAFRAWGADGGSDPRAVLSEIGSLQAALVEAHADAAQQFADGQRWLHGLLWTALLLALVWVTAAYQSFRDWFGRPLDRIAAAVDRVSAGDFHHHIPDVGSRQLRRLAQDVERMRARTVGLYEASQRAVEALAQQGAAVTSLRSELAPSRSDLPSSAVFAAVLEPAEGVLAGDWYDCVNLGEGRVALAVVDVTGHGPQAGIFALRAKHLLVPALRGTPSPGAALSWLAGMMGDTGERFLSAFLAEVDTNSGMCRWANAGHPSAFVVGRDQVIELGQTGPILGPLQATWATRELRLCPDSTLVAYTDGLVEARSGDQEFGSARLFRVLQDRAGSDPASVITAALREVRGFAGGRVHDDITVVALAMARTPETAGRTEHAAAIQPPDTGSSPKVVFQLR